MNTGKVAAQGTAVTGIHVLFLNSEDTKGQGERPTLKLREPSLRKCYLNQEGKLGASLKEGRAEGSRADRMPEGQWGWKAESEGSAA